MTYGLTAQQRAATSTPEQLEAQAKAYNTPQESSMQIIQLAAPFPIYRIELPLGESIMISGQALSVTDRDGDVASIEITPEVRRELAKLLRTL